jgi:hypothetical protein
VLLLAYGGATIIEPGVLALAGNQPGSDSLAAHPLQAPWTLVMLWLGAVGLVLLAYAMGRRFAAIGPKAPGEHAAGFLTGALNGLFIAVSCSARVAFHQMCGVSSPPAG